VSPFYRTRFSTFALCAVTAAIIPLLTTITALAGQSFIKAHVAWSGQQDSMSPHPNSHASINRRKND
jgi:hypothetical protein